MTGPPSGTVGNDSLLLELSLLLRRDLSLRVGHREPVEQLEKRDHARPHEQPEDAADIRDEAE